MTVMAARGVDPDDSNLIVDEQRILNAQLIVDCATLGYIRKSDRVLDPTYGRGLWWKLWRPDDLVIRDRKLDRAWNYREMAEFEDATFDVVTFDPPYVAQGGRATIGEGAEDFADRFGMVDCPRSPEELLRDNCAGLLQCARVTKPGGIILAKCKPYVSSGKLFPAHHLIFNYADVGLGLIYVDEFTHAAGTGPQPQTNLDGTERRQVHARQNASVLFVFRVPKE